MVLTQILISFVFSLGDDAKLVEYASTHDGMTLSWKERFTSDEYKRIDKALGQLYQRDLPYFTDNKAA